MSKKILVTGANGFIGSHVVEALILKGYSVKALVHYNSLGNLGWLKSSNSVEIIFGDIRDSELMMNISKNCNIIINLASLISIPYSYIATESYFQTNVMGTLNLLKAARNNDIDLYIQTSTSEVFGSAQYIPIDEKHPRKAQSPYAATKISADSIVEAFNLSYGLNTLILRPFNTYGPRQSTRAIIPTIIMQLLDKKRFLKLGNLDTTRDLTFVTDTAQAFLKAIDTPFKQGNDFNLGTGYEVKIRNLAEIISDIMGIEFEFILDPLKMRPDSSEVLQLCSNNTRAKEILGWFPEYVGESGLRLGLEKTIQWYKNNSKYVTLRENIFL